MTALQLPVHECMHVKVTFLHITPLSARYSHTHKLGIDPVINFGRNTPEWHCNSSQKIFLLNVLKETVPFLILITTSSGRAEPASEIKNKTRHFY